MSRNGAMDEIVALASRLGELLARHERYLRLRSAEEAVEQDPQARGLLDRLEEQRRKVASLEAQARPVEPEDKRELQRLADAVHSNQKLQELARAQADYMEMMHKVNHAIRARLSGRREPAGEQPAG